MPPPLKLTDLIDGLDWVSAAGPFENAAYIDRNTGKLYLITDADEFEEEQPDNFDDASLYLAIPHKHDLDLGRNTVFQFIDECLPGSADVVRAIFQKKGAYAKFKGFLERKNQLEAWWAFEAKATETALREWADEHDLTLESD